mmetsp:Transcript_111570/g.266153  ORF Transcript_111570/g.266153 Transcript_111570/m.266153 type:complete len:204 (-) Transcript_111570:174-785(-)
MRNRWFKACRSSLTFSDFSVTAMVVRRFRIEPLGRAGGFSSRFSFGPLEVACGSASFRGSSSCRTDLRRPAARSALTSGSELRRACGAKAAAAASSRLKGLSSSFMRASSSCFRSSSVSFCMPPTRLLSSSAWASLLACSSLSCCTSATTRSRSDFKLRSTSANLPLAACRDSSFSACTASNCFRKLSCEFRICSVSCPTWRS